MRAVFDAADRIPPGVYLRRWRGHEVVVEVRIAGRRLVEITPAGGRREPADNEGATYVSVDV